MALVIDSGSAIRANVAGIGDHLGIVAAREGDNGGGVGRIVDEFALLWNLNPDYYQPLSRFAAGVVLLLIAQVVYFRDLYVALGKRLFRLWVRT